MKIVINRQFGVFSISREAAEYMAKRGSKQARAEIAEWKEDGRLIGHYRKTGKWPKGSDRERTDILAIHAKYFAEAIWYGFGYARGDEDGYDRADPLLVEAVEKLGGRANGEHATLEVVEIPDGVEFEIHEYGGLESIHEKHRSWP